MPWRLVDPAHCSHLSGCKAVGAVTRLALEHAWVELAGWGVLDHSVLHTVVHVARVQDGPVNHRQLAGGYEGLRRPVRCIMEPHLRDSMPRPEVGEVHRDGRVEIVGKTL